MPSGILWTKQFQNSNDQSPKRDALNAVRKFVYGPGIDEPILMIDVTGGNMYYYHFDGLGSVAALSDVNRDIVERYSYDVFGEPNRVSDVNNPYFFTARRFDDESGLYYYRFRYYQPQIGRFLQTDPIHYLGGLNLYTYCRNNPVNWVDPWGLLGWRSAVGAAMQATGGTLMALSYKVSGVNPTAGGACLGIGAALFIGGFGLQAWDLSIDAKHEDTNKSLEKIKKATESWEDKDGDGFPDIPDDDDKDDDDKDDDDKDDDDKK